MTRAWRCWLPPLMALAVALAPVPAGLPQHAWYYFAIFVGVIAGVVLEPLPGGAVGLIGVTLVDLLSRFVLFGPADLERPGFSAANAGLHWALSGFANGTVWLVFAAFMFSLGYARTGLGRRIALVLVRRMGHHTLMLGYAVALADAAIGPFTPSVTARSGGIIYPLIANLPGLYGSKPNDPSARRIGSYLMWVSVASTSVTSTLFLTALAPNLLALELINESLHFRVGWLQWFLAAAPLGISLLLLVPLLTYWIYPPSVKSGTEVPAWAARQLAEMGPLSRREIILALLVTLALGLWMGAGEIIDPATTALLVIVLMLLTSVLSWEDLLENRSAWNTLVWFATLVAMAAGLGKVGFIDWFTQAVGGALDGISTVPAMIAVCGVFFLSHYMFASLMAHATAFLPVMLALGIAMPAIPDEPFALLLSQTMGLMGVLTPYAAGSSPVYYGSGFLPSHDYWRLGALFGAIFFAAFVLISLPWVLKVGPGLFLP